LKQKNLKNTEIIGKSDPYVSIQYEEEIVRSETKKNTLTPSWNWETSVDLKDFRSDLILTIFDSDKIGKDQKMGSIIFKKESMKNYIADQPMWLSFMDDKPGQVLVFFELIDKPESKLPIGNINQDLKDDITLRSEDNEEQNKITTNENQVPSKGNEVNSKDIQRAGTLKEEGNVDDKHNMDLENQIINDKSEVSNQTSKGASGLRNLLNEEDKLGSIDDKVLTIEIAKHVDPRKDKDDNVPDQIAKPGQNEGARGLRDILSEGDKDDSRNVQESKNGTEKPLDPKIDTKIDIHEKSSNAESLDALPKSETNSKRQKLGGGADNLRNILDHKKEIQKTENEHDKLKVVPSQGIKKDKDKQDASKAKDGAEVILNNETSMSVEDEYGSEKYLKSKTGKYTREDKKDIEPTDEILESQADKTKGDVQAKSNEGAEGLKEIPKRQTDSNETVKLGQAHISKDTATFEGAVGLRKILNKKDKVTIDNETSISVNDGYLAEKETSNEGKDRKEAKEETNPKEGKNSEETGTKESKEETKPTDEATELSSITIRAAEEAEGVREILGQPKDNENAGKEEKENVPENTAQHEGAVGLRKILNEKENDKTVDKNISHSNEQGITQINVDSDHIEDTNRENNEEENGLTNLKNMTDLIRIKLDNKSNQRRSEPGTRYSFSTITEVKTFQSTEEIKETIAGDLLKTRSAIKKRRTVIIQETIVMIVESVSNWLDKVEYRISTVKKIKTVNQKKQELKSIKEEIEVIEETVDELVEVTEMAVEVIDDESKVTITSCVSCLNDQVKVVKLYHQQSEDELSDSEEKWEEYVEGIKTIERLIKDLRSEVDKLGKSDSISEEKVDTLEQYQMMNKGHMNKVVYLLATGKGLTDQLPENQIPEQVYTIYEKAKMIDTAIQNEKEETINLILSKDEYENTLAEYREIVDVAEDFLKSKLAVLDLSHFNEEIVRQKKFFLNLSHCMQVLDSLEANFSEQMKQHYSAVYEDLHKRSKQIIENSARYINDLDETLSSWSTINSEISALKSELEIVKTRISNFDSCTTYNYLEQLENCKRYELQLEALRIKSIIFQEKSEQLQQNISSPALNNLFTELNYEIPNMLDVINKDIEKYKSFRTLWKEYEDIQTTIQPWLAMVESQLEKDGNVDLIYSELNAYSNIHEKANANFSAAMQTIQLDDEDMQRQLHIQFEIRWNSLKDKLEKVISERKEIDFNNFLGFQDETEKLMEQARNTTEVPFSNIATTEDLLAYIQKLSFLVVSLERRLKQIATINTGNKNFESAEKIGNLKSQVKQCIDMMAKRMDMGNHNFENLQEIRLRLDKEELEIESTKVQLINVKKEPTNIGNTIKAKLLSVQAIKKNINILDCRLQMIKEDLKQLKISNPNMAVIQNLDIKFTSVENVLKELIKDAEETQMEATEEGILWDDMNEKMKRMRQCIGETNFKLELFLARGHIDIKRLEAATQNIKALETQHLSYDQNLKDLKETTNSVIAVASKQDGLELSAQLESIIISYNSVCADLLDVGTRYDSSVLLWQRFISMTMATRQWIEDATRQTVEISASTAQVEDLLLQIKNLETAEHEQEEVIGQLKQLTTDICIQVGMDEGGRSHFVVEVDDLTHRIVTLRDTITGLHQTLNNRQNDINKTNGAVKEVQNVIDDVKNALSITTPAEIISSLPPEDAVDQLSALRGQLLKLGKAESHISGLRPDATSSCTALVPYNNTNDSIVNILQLWQTVFEDTLSRYHRMSALLASQHAKDATLRVWESHLDQVAANLSAPPSASYTEIAEQMRMASLHRSLLTQSQQLMLRTSAPMHGQVQKLTERNQEVLDQLEQRAVLLRSRHALWDNYNSDQERLLSWLRDMEREKQMLNLKHVAIKRIPKVLKKIDYLLEKMPLGEKILKDLVAQQAELQANYDSNTISSVRIELHSIQERISSLRAGLRTWKDHLHRVQRLASECDEKEEKALQAMEKPKEILDTPIPKEVDSAQRDLLLCKESTVNLESLTPELEDLNLLQEELKECVSPSDIKQTSQRAWLLWQKQADMKHQLALRMQLLESRSALLDLFRTQQSRFVEWTDRMEQRLESKDAGVQDLINKFETDYRGEITLKEKELSWLNKVKEQLSSASPQEIEEVKDATIISQSRYSQIISLHSNKLAKLKDILSEQVRLEAEIRQLKLWLTELENRLNEPSKFKGIGLDEYKNNLKSHSDIEKQINKNSEKVSTILNQGEILINDFDNPSASSTTHHIQNDITNIEARWTNLCFKISERKKGTIETWEQWQLYLEKYRMLSKWMEKRLSITKFDIKEIKLENCKEKQKELDMVMSDINENLNTLDEFNSLFCMLATEGKLDESGELKKIQNTTNEEWEALTDKTISHIKMLAEKYDSFESFMALKEREITWLRQLDAQLTEIEYSSSMDDDVKQKRLIEIKTILSDRKPKLHNVMKVAQNLVNNYHEEDIARVNINVDALNLLNEDVESRLSRLLDDLCMEDHHQLLRLTVHKARNLARNNKFVKADPYVILKYESEKRQSNSVKGTQDPEWQFDADFMINENSSREISIEVYDQDYGDDEPMGLVSIDISDINSSNKINERWVPLKNCKSGDVLISAKYITGFEKSEKLTEQFAEEPARPINLTVHKARNLKRNNKFVKADPYLILRCGNQKHQSQTIKGSQNPQWEFGTNFQIQAQRQILVEVYDEDFGDDEPMGVAAIDISLISESNPLKNIWLPLILKDTTSGEIEVSAGYGTGKESSWPQESKEESIQHLLLIVHKARNLARNNKFVKSDPYVVLKYRGQSHKSQTIKSSQDPEWQYEAHIKADMLSSENILLEIYDQDYGEDEPMGVAHINALEISEANYQLQEKWITLINCKSGEVQISAKIFTGAESGNQSSQGSQIDTLKFEQDRSVQTDTLSLPVPDSGVFMSTSITSPGTDTSYGAGTPDDLVPEIEKDEIDDVKPLPVLTDRSKDQLISELDTNILDCKKNVENFELALDITEDQDHLLSELTKCRTSLSLCQHYSSVLHSRFGLTGSTIRETSIKELQKMIANLQEKLKMKEAESVGASSRTYSEALKSGSVDEKSGSVSPGSTCPLCRRRNWKQLEGDLWRLERWLEHAGGSLALLLRNGVPGSIEQLEEVIQDHREFLLDLDSHKSVAMSINVVGCHLAEHTPTQSKAEAMRTRLATVNEKWDHVCEQATLWQTRLQTALLENGEFHQTIQELLQWLEATTATIKEAEPVDLSVSKAVLQTKYNKFLELQKDLQRCEPRVVSLQEAADQLELQADSPACKQVKKKLAILSRSLRSLIQVCGIYLTSLARALGLPPPPQISESLYDSALNIHDTVLPPLTDQLMAVESPEQAQAAPKPRSSEQSDDDLNTGVLSRSYRFLGRVVRAAVPIQALMLLLLGVSSIVPLDQDELICSLQNNLQRSLEPMLQWSNGPPPI